MADSCFSKPIVGKKTSDSNVLSEKDLEQQLSTIKNIDILGKQLSTVLGLDFLETKIYLNLLRIGPISASALAKKIDVERTKMYRTVEKLISQNIITTTFTKPKLCIATEPEDLLKMVMQRKEDDLKKLKVTKGSVIKKINEIICVKEIPKVPTFHIVQGSSNIFSEIGRLIENSTNTVYIVTTISDISKMYHTNIPEKIQICKKNGGEVLLLTELNDYNLIPYIERLGPSLTRLGKLNSKGRIIVEKGKQMIMSDATLSESNHSKVTSDFAFSTNSYEMVNNIDTLCTLLWRNSEPIEELSQKYN